MLKQLMLGTALSALLLSGALAQAPADADKSKPPAAQSQSGDNAKPGDQAKTNENATFVAAQKPDQWLASKFEGTDVIGPDDKKIGDVSDILFDRSGKIEAYVVSVGGFLGMGAKDVALAPDAFDTIPSENGGPDKLKLSMSQDELKAAQNFEPYQPPRPVTTGAANRGPSGSPLAPRPSPQDRQ